MLSACSPPSCSQAHSLTDSQILSFIDPISHFSFLNSGLLSHPWRVDELASFGHRHYTPFLLFRTPLENVSDCSVACRREIDLCLKSYVSLEYSARGINLLGQGGNDEPPTVNSQPLKLVGSQPHHTLWSDLLPIAAASLTPPHLTTPKLPQPMSSPCNLARFESIYSWTHTCHLYLSEQCLGLPPPTLTTVWALFSHDSQPRELGHLATAGEVTPVILTEAGNSGPFFCLTLSSYHWTWQPRLASCAASVCCQADHCSHRLALSIILTVRSLVCRQPVVPSTPDSWINSKSSEQQLPRLDVLRNSASWRGLFGASTVCVWQWWWLCMLVWQDLASE